MSNHIVIIAGSNGLIGKSILSKVKESKIYDIVCLDIFPEVPTSTKFDHNKSISYYNLDVRNYKDINQIFISLNLSSYEFVTAINCTYPKPDTWGKKLEDLSPEDLNNHIQSILSSSLFFVKAFVQNIGNKKKGHLINLSSVQGLFAPKFNHYEGTSMHCPIEYTACKAATIAYTKWAAKYYKDENIRFNCVCPGGVIAGQEKVFLDNYKKDCTSKGMLDPSDVSAVISFLIGEDASMINGQSIVVDDGWSL